MKEEVAINTGRKVLFRRSKKSGLSEGVTIRANQSQRGAAYRCSRGALCAPNLLSQYVPWF